jgi:hypothetical protein
MYANRSGNTPEHRDQQRTLTHSLSISQTLLLYTNNYMNLHLFIIFALIVKKMLQLHFSHVYVLIFFYLLYNNPPLK